MTKKTKIHVRNITVALKTAKLCKCFILAVISFIRVTPLSVEKAPSVFAPSSSFSTKLFFIALSGCWKATGRQVEPQAAGTGWSGEQRPFPFLTTQYPPSTWFHFLIGFLLTHSHFHFSDSGLDYEDVWRGWEEGLYCGRNYGVWVHRE